MESSLRMYIEITCRRSSERSALFTRLDSEKKATWLSVNPPFLHWISQTVSSEKPNEVFSSYHREKCGR